MSAAVLDARQAIAWAEASGAAPGAEWREPAPASTARAPRRVARPIAFAAALVALAGVALVGHAGYLHLKAWLGQRLIERAFEAGVAGGTTVAPWPWADMHPVARLVAARHGVDLYVLSGASGRTLAWGPGHVESTPRPGDAGNAVVTGHRDTHFAFLRALTAGDLLTIETVQGRRRDYRVQSARVAHHQSLAIGGSDAPMLTLVTCHPFDAVAPDTPWRYVVSATAIR